MARGIYILLLFVPAHITGVYIHSHLENLSHIYTTVICAGTYNRSIYIRTEEEEKNNNSLPLKGKISPGKGFLWGDNTSENGAWYLLGGHSERYTYKICKFCNPAQITGV